MRLGISNGSLLKREMEMLQKAGITFNGAGRGGVIKICGYDLVTEIVLARPQMMPWLIKEGCVDFGICGWDCVVEAGLDNQLEKMAEFSFGKNLSRPVRVVLYGEEEKFIDEARSLVITEYPNITKKFVRFARTLFSFGTTEACVKAVSGRPVFGVGIVETGRSLRENNLLEIETFLVSPVVLVSKTRNPVARELADRLSR